MMQNNADSH